MKGARADIEDKEGKTPIDYAEALVSPEGEVDIADKIRKILVGTKKEGNALTGSKQVHEQKKSIKEIFSFLLIFTLVNFVKVTEIYSRAKREW